MRARAFVIALIAGAFAACRSDPSRGTAAPIDASITPSSTTVDASPSSPVDAAAITFDAASPEAVVDAAVFTVDGGAPACPRVFGPMEQSFLGPAVLDVTARGLEIVTNDHGAPRTAVVPIGAPQVPRTNAAALPVSASSATHDVVSWPPCVLGGHFVYCVASGGALVRIDRGSGQKKEISRARTSTKIAAATLAHDHSVVVYLADRYTEEGFVSEAHAIVDDEPSVRLSDEGSGATFIDLAPRGDEVVAAYLDARMAMTPVHARSITWGEGAAHLGKDVVLFVGGVPERSLGAALGTGPSHAALFLPISREAEGFGLATIPIEEPLHEDVAATWSMYPNGLDPAPIAATRARDPMYVARVRPMTASPKSSRVLELGRVDEKGVFTALATIAEGHTLTDLAIATDSFGAIWILYSDARASWLERRVCP